MKTPSPTTKPSALVEISLSAVERVTLLMTLPEQGGIATARLVQKLRDRLNLTPEEVKRLNIVIDKDRMQFDVAKDRSRSFGFSGFEVELIVSRLRALDKDEKISVQHVSLWAKFIDGAAE